MTYLSELRSLDAQVSATRDLPPDEQAEALAAMFQGLDRAERQSFVALLIGEVIALREAASIRKPRPSPVPDLSAS